MTWRKCHRNRRKHLYGPYGSRKIVRIGSMLLDLRSNAFNFKTAYQPVVPQGWVITVPEYPKNLTTGL